MDPIAKVWSENRIVSANLGQARVEHELHDLADDGRKLQGQYIEIKDSG